jgi:MinD-like ATPase involved in chromosome partitioning or flagellar assembly
VKAVVLTAVKGGVGVSTLALMLAKALAEQGNSVTLVDMDVAGYISSIANIRVNGLLAQSVDGEKLVAGYAGKIGRIHVVKFLGDGMRFFDDVEKLRRNPDQLTKLVAEYTAVSSDSDYLVIDVAPCFLDLILKSPFISYWLISPASFRIYVTDDKRPSITATVSFIKRVEDGFAAGQPFAVVINKAHDLEKSIAEKLREETESTHLLTIPFTPQLLHFSGDLGELPVFDQIKTLAHLLSFPPVVEITHYFDEKMVSKEKVNSALKTDRSTLLIVPPERRDTNTLSTLLARLSYGREVVIIKNPFIERRFHINEFIVTPRYNFLRFEVRNINEVYKLAKRFGEEVLRIVANKTRPVAVLINEAELGPESTCCDVITQRREFWKTFLVHLSENAPALHTVLICEDIAGRCGPLVDIFEAAVKL